MLRFRKSVLLTAALVVAATLGAPASAHAALQIALQQAGVNGGAITVVGTAADFSSVAFTGSYGSFTVTIFGGSSQNGASLSDLLGSNTRITNDTGLSQTLNLYVTQNNYTLPAGSPLKVESGMSFTNNAGSVGLNNIFQAYADDGNNLFGFTDFTNGPQNAVLNVTTGDTGSATGFFNRVGTYSLTSRTTFAVTGGYSGNFSNHINVTPVPAPAGIVLALTGIPLLGLRNWLRRRKAVVA